MFYARSEEIQRPRGLRRRVALNYDDAHEEAIAGDIGCQYRRRASPCGRSAKSQAAGCSRVLACDGLRGHSAMYGPAVRCKREFQEQRS